MTHEEKWLGIWYGFVADLLKEYGYLEIRKDILDQQKRESLISFLDKLDMLRRVIPLMEGFSKVLSSEAKPDPDDIQKIGGILEELWPSPAVEQLKSNIMEFKRS